MYMRRGHSLCSQTHTLAIHTMLSSCPPWPLMRCPLSPCATHLPKRRPPACMWLWTVCQRPALPPPISMLRTLSLRLGPAPEQAPPPLSLAPGEGPAPPCPPLSTAPLGGAVEGGRGQRNTDRQEERTQATKRKEREREGQTRDRRETDVQSRRAKGSSVQIVKPVKPVSETLCEPSVQPTSVNYTTT